MKILIKNGGQIGKNGELYVAHRAMCVTLLLLLYVLLQEDACTSWMRKHLELSVNPDIP